MASKLVAAFLRCSLSPLNQAAGCLMGGAVAEGLQELSGTKLLEGFMIGLDLSARGAGVTVRDVEPHLPMPEIRGQIQRVTVAHEAVMHAWQIHASQLGGIFAAVTDLTVDGRAPDIAQFLERLSKKLIRDAALAEPLHVLGGEVQSWVLLIDQCRAHLESGVLAKAYARRRARRIALSSGAGVLLLILISLGVRVAVARVRVGRAITSSDPCDQSRLSHADLSWASGAQHRRVTDLARACDEQTRREAHAREEAHRREELALEEQRARVEREARCAAIGDALGGTGDLGPTPEGDDGALLQRIKRGPLLPADMAVAALPCAQTATYAKVLQAFEAAVLTSPAAWANADVLSDPVRKILTTRVANLKDFQKRTFAWRAEEAAKRALVSGKPDQLERAVDRCRLKEDLGIKPGTYCRALAGIKPRI